MYHVYILYSEKLNRFYVGYSNNLQRRLGEHNRKKGKYTDAGIPWVLKYSEEFESKTEAQTREKYLKSRKSKKFIEQLINNY